MREPTPSGGEDKGGQRTQPYRGACGASARTRNTPLLFHVVLHLRDLEFDGTLALVLEDVGVGLAVVHLLRPLRLRGFVRIVGLLVLVPDQGVVLLHIAAAAR